LKLAGRLAIRDILGIQGMADNWELTGRFMWSNGFSVEYECRLEPPNCRTLRLRYETNDEYDDEVVDIDETIYLRRFPQPYGGYRWYFICPSNNRRCSVLLKPPGGKRFRSRRGFRCRLQYQSQRLSPMSRYQRGAAKAAKQVLRKGPPEWREEFEDWDFPPKPKWMRWKTYNRLDEKAQAYDKAFDDELLWRVRRLLLPGEGIDGLMDRILK
jgi:hypothetical protein